MLQQVEVFETVVDGFRFRVSTWADGYEVRWLDCPNETYPSGYRSRTVGAIGADLPVSSREEIIAELGTWLRVELEERGLAGKDESSRG